MPYTRYLIDGGYEGTPTTSMTLVQLTETSVEARILDADTIPNKYKITFQKKKLFINSRKVSSYVNDGSAKDYIFDAPLSGAPIITGLSSQGVYDVTLTKVTGETSNVILTEYEYILSSVSANGSFLSNATNTQKTTTTKSFFTLANRSNTKNEFAVAQRTFDSAPAPSGFYPTPTGSKSLYYSFGTSIFMEPKEEASNQSAGLLFFSDSTSKRGYMIKIKTTATAATQDAKVFEILYLDGTKQTSLATSQKSAISTLDAVFAGTAYQLDVKVKMLFTQPSPSANFGTFKITIDAYVNGFKINTTHTIPIYPADSNSFFSNGVGIFTEQGLAMFDYVYARKLDDETQYNAIDPEANYYNGQFSNDLLDINFGNLFYDFNSDEDDYAKSVESVDEFGKSVREIAYVKTKLTRPSFPISWSVGNSKFAKIIASKVSSFAAESYVLNTSSASIPLQSSNGASFYLFGNTLSPSGQVEYLTNKSDLYEPEEPMVFTSKWIQNKNDAKSIGDWIKSKFINRGQIISLTTFGNPLLSVGDIITIKYDYEGLDGTAKFIITTVTQNFAEGLETTLICRSL